MEKDLFWQVYNNLEKEELQNPSNYMKVDKNTISRRSLHQALISSGHFYQGDAYQIIKDMVKAGKLKEVMLDTYQKI